MTQPLPSIFSYAPKLGTAMLKGAPAQSPERKEPEKKPPNQFLHAAKVLGTVGGGIALGTGLGLLADHAIGAGYKWKTGKELPIDSIMLKAGPYIGGGMGLLWSLLQAKQTEEMRRGIPHYGAHPAAAY